MTTNFEYALFSANVYGNSKVVRSSQNTLPIPDGWEAIGTPVVLSDGFMARAYKKGGEIVISYAGTTDEDKLDWLTGNFPAGTAAFPAPQIVDAAKFYLDIAKANPSISNISFTGHSLGGGLASLMAVYFNKPAVVFDEGPFQKSADSATVVNAIKAALALAYTLPTEFTAYIAGDPTGAIVPSPTRLARQGNVSQIYTKGEVLSLASTTMLNFVSVALGLINPTLWILGTGVDKVRGREQQIDPKAQSILGWGSSATNGDPLDLHSISLLSGFVESPQFLAAVQAYPELLPRLFAGIYKNAPKLDNANLIDLLAQREYRGEGSLGALTVDVTKINRDIGLASLKDLPNSGGKGLNNVTAILMDAVLANLYQQGKTRAPEQGFVEQFNTLLRPVTGGLTADLQVLGKEADKLASEFNRMFSLLVGDDANSAPYSQRARWTLQNGADALSVDLSSDALDDVVLGFDAADTINGGDGDDVLAGLGGTDTLKGGAGIDHLFGGEGNDTLDGGSGGDWLYGGAGSDTYQLKSGELFDVIEDSDGNGVITVDGIALTGGKKSGEGYWISTDSDWGYMLSGSGDLTISKGSSLDRITIRNWQSNGGNHLGIVLDDAPAPPTPSTHIYTGDQRAPLIGTETQTTVSASDPSYGTYAWGATSWVADGTLNNGVAEADFNDVITGSAENDDIKGLGGSDALDGGAGNDTIDGGAGNDLIAGGAGADTIKGGDGNDYINSSATLTVVQRNKPGDSWSPPAGQSVITQGPGWGIYNDTLNGEPTLIWSGSNSPAGTDGDTIDGGAGNDHIIASGGTDRVQGGLGDDQIDGMGGNDILEGGDGKDTILGDGLIQPGFMDSVDAQYHGADFIDGGAGDDTPMAPLRLESYSRHARKAARNPCNYQNNSRSRIFHGGCKPICLARKSARRTTA